MVTVQIRGEEIFHWIENMKEQTLLFQYKEVLSFQFMVLFLRTQEHNFKNRKHDGFSFKLNNKMKAIITQIHLAN